MFSFINNLNLFGRASKLQSDVDQLRQEVDSLKQLVASLEAEVKELRPSLIEAINSAGRAL
jgi:cell division protein FtsB